LNLFDKFNRIYQFNLRYSYKNSQPLDAILRYQAKSFFRVIMQLTPTEPQVSFIQAHRPKMRRIEPIFGR
jgi:hypothetical protein